MTFDTCAASTTTYLHGLDLISETNSVTGVTSYPLTDGLANKAGAVGTIISTGNAFRTFLTDMALRES